MEKTADFTYYEDLQGLVGSVADDSILSRTIHGSERVKAVVFGFAAGQSLSEHTAADPAIVQIISGTGTLQVGGQSMAARPGTWLYMPARTTHGVQAETPLVMLLLLLKG